MLEYITVTFVLVYPTSQVWPLASNEFISTRVSTTERFQKAFARILEKKSPFFSKRFVSPLPDTSFEVCWQMGLPLPTGSALHCFPDWSTGGDNDLWSVLPCDFYALWFWLAPNYLGLNITHMSWSKKLVHAQIKRGRMGLPTTIDVLRLGRRVAGDMASNLS